MSQHDVLIIGGGPAGLSAAMYLARANVRALILDQGGPRHAAADAMHSLVTHDGREPMAFRALAHEQLAAYGDLVERQDATVAAVHGEKGRFVAETASGERHEGKRVLLAVGVKDELPAIPGVKEGWAVSVHHCPFCWGFEGKGGRMGLLIDQAPAALSALPIGRLAGELHGFWQGEGEAPAALKELFARRGHALHEDRVVALDLDGRELRAVRTQTGATLALDTLYVHPRQRQVPLVTSLGLALDEQGSVVVDAMFQTSVPGIYAAGDLVTRRRQQVVHALSMGAEAGPAMMFDLEGGDDVQRLMGAK